MKFGPLSFKKTVALPKKFSKTGLTILGLLIISLLAVWGSWKSMTEPAKGIIKKPAEIFSSEPEISYIMYAGQRAEFSYPRSSRIEKNDKLPQSATESYWITALGTPKSPAWYIAITVYKLPSLNPSDNSTYRIREDNPRTYAKSTASIDGKKITMFENEDTSERTAYMQSGGLLAAVALSGASQNPAAISDFERILASWKWK